MSGSTGIGIGQRIRNVDPPQSAKKRMRRGDPGRTGPRKKSGRSRRHRSGAAIPPRRFSKENRRCGGVKGRAEIQASSEERAGNFPSTDPNRSKAGAGSRGKSHHGSIACHAQAVHAGWRASCLTGHLEPFLFLSACPLLTVPSLTVPPAAKYADRSLWSRLGNGSRGSIQLLAKSQEPGREQRKKSPRLYRMPC